MEEFIRKLATWITEDPDMPAEPPADDPLNIRARAGRFQGKPHFTGPDSNIEREVIEGAEQVFWAGTNTGGEWIVMDGGGREHYVESDSDTKTLTVTKLDGTPLITYKVNVSVIPVDEGPVDEGPVEEEY